MTRETEVKALVNCDKEVDTHFQHSSQCAFRAAYAVLRNHADAEDITQDAMVRAYQALAQLREQSSIHSWAARIAWRLALNQLRSQRSRARLESLTVPSAQAAGALDGVIMRDRSDRLHKAIDTLPQPFRVVTVMAGIEECSIKDIAVSLQVSEGTVKSRLFRARQMLKRMLK